MFARDSNVNNARSLNLDHAISLCATLCAPFQRENAVATLDRVCRPNLS